MLVTSVDSSMAQPTVRDKAGTMGTVRALLVAARPFKKRFALIALFALLGTGADLIEPLIYRIAINDVAGLFVRPGQTSTGTGTPSLDQKPAAAREPKSARAAATKTEPANKPEAANHAEARKRQESARKAEPSAAAKGGAQEHAAPQKHRRGFVAPRTPRQTLTTLLWSVVAILIIGV